MIEEAAPTKGQLRKLNALRRSLGPDIADEAFAKWLDQAIEAPEGDNNMEIISDALRNLRFRKSGSRSDGAAVSCGGAASG